MGLLQRLLGWFLEVVFVTRCLRRGLGDEQGFLVQQGQPGFPLGIGKRRAICLQKLAQGQTLRQIGVALFDRHNRGGLSRRPDHVAHQVDHPIAALDVGIQHLQGFIAGDNEILLHLHLHIGARKALAQ